MTRNVFIGYGQAENWLQNHPAGLPVNVDTITEERSSGQYDLGRAVTYLVLSYHEQGIDEVHYLQVRVDAWQTIHGKPFAQNEDEAMKIHQRRAETALAAAEDWLHSQGIPFRRAVISIPDQHKMLEGNASWLHYYKDTDEYGVWEAG